MALLPGIRSNDKLSRNNVPGGPRNMKGGDRAVRFKMRGMLKYSLLPGIIPRIRNLGVRMGMMAYMLAMIFYSAGLLPKGHPYLNTVNVGRYGMIDAIAAAANNIVLDRKHLDKIMIFGAIVMALVIMAIQIFLILLYVMFGSSAQAQETFSGGTSTSASSIFGMFSLTSDKEQKDVVMHFLEQVTGLNIFVKGDVQTIGISLSSVIHDMLGFFSMAMLLIAVLIVIYYIVVVVGEAAQSGKPFGGRFNSLWAPIRLVLALGLLVPFGSGLNAAQYLVLYTAKAGSSFASNVWDQVYESVSDPAKTVVPPFPVEMHMLAKQIFLNEVCMEAYNRFNIVNGEPTRQMQSYVLIPNGLNTDGRLQSVVSSATTNSGIRPGAGTANGNIEWRWLDIETKPHNAGGGRTIDLWRGNCAAMEMKLSAESLDSTGRLSEAADEGLQAYVEAIDALIGKARPLAAKFASYHVNNEGSEFGEGELPSAEEFLQAIQDVDEELINTFVTRGEDWATVVLEESLGDYDGSGGWGGAASLYIKLAYASQHVKRLFNERVPVGMSVSQTAREGAERWRDSTGRHWALWGQGDLNDRGEAIESAVVHVVQAADRDFVSLLPSDRPMSVKHPHLNPGTWDPESGGYAFLDWIFPVDTLLEMSNPRNQDIFPMIHLTTLGSDLMSRSLSAFIIGGTLGAFSGLASMFTVFKDAGNIAGAMGSMVFIVGFIGLGIGFLLAIVVPLMPFIYFFFAIVEWAMGIIEALVGVPLWALAHLRIDGDGIPGPVATQGYFILFGILLKPFLILFSLFASYVMFNAAAYFLNLTFGGAVGLIPNIQDNIFGFEQLNFGLLSSIQRVGYLIMYAVIVYNLALVCFKMIDQIPAQVMRWIGQSNVFYNDGKEDPIGMHSRVAMLSGAMLASGAANHAGRVFSAAGKGGGAVGKGAKDFITKRGKGGASTEVDS